MTLPQKEAVSPSNLLKRYNWQVSACNFSGVSRPEGWVIAFVTGAISNEIQPYLTRPSLSVFIPKTPNPTTGWYAIVPEDEVVNLRMSVEDIFKVVIYRGIVASNTSPSLVIFQRKLEPLLPSEEY